jgi:hypothetical protein
VLLTESGFEFFQIRRDDKGICIWEGKQEG